MRYETKMCQYCKNVTRHRIDEYNNEEICLKCNNEPPKIKNYRYKGFL